MTALHLKNRQLSLKEDFSEPQVGSDEVLLKIRLAGICGTDLALLKGYADFTGVPGHEFIAEVIEVGGHVDREWLSKRVVAEINQWCGECDQCKRNQQSHCLNRKVIGIRNHQGAFAEQLVVKANTLHEVPDSISDRQAVFIEPLAAAFRIVEQLQNRNYHDVLVVGAGRLGQLIARVMVLQGKAIKIVARHSRQRERLQQLQVECVGEAEVEPKSFDVAIDATGHSSGLELALKALRPLGCCVMKSSYGEPLSLDLSRLVIDEIELIGSRCGPFDRAIDALARGEIETDSLIDGTYPLAEYEAAFTAAAAPGGMKVLFEI